MHKIIMVNCTIAMILIVCACSEDSNGVDNNPQSGTPLESTELSATVDGVEWVAKTVRAEYLSIAGNLYYRIKITGTNGNESITLNLYTPSTGLPTQFDARNNRTTGSFSQNGETYTAGFDDSPGTVTVTKLDLEKKIVSAEFSFVTQFYNSRSHRVENGKITDATW